MTEFKEFKVGDEVCVLRGGRPSPVEHILGYGTITRVTNGNLFWVSGFPCARTSDVLRHVTPKGLERCCSDTVEFIQRKKSSEGGA